MPSATKTKATQRTSTFTKLYQQLNDAQRSAVDTIEGPVMVVAGAGTGKTQVVAMRIANILRLTQMDPWNILCLTFTESGVVAMRERLLQIIGAAGYYVRIHTFHSFCNDVIQDNPEVFASARSRQPLSDIERVQLWRELTDGLPGTSPLKPLGQPYLFLKDIIGNVRDLKQENISPARLHEVLQAVATFVSAVEPAWQTFAKLQLAQRTPQHCARIQQALEAAAREAKLPEALLRVLQRHWRAYQEREKSADDLRARRKCQTQYKNDVKRSLERLARQLPKQQDVQRLYAHYQQELEHRGRYDFEDMITFVVEAMVANHDLLARYQEQFQYILVDEYQDTNGAQNALLHRLGSFDEQPNLFVVGDDQQSIYRFQGASLHNMLEFYQHYQKHVRIISLSNNYRSQPIVLHAAAAVAGNNRETLEHYLPGLINELHAATPRPTQPILWRDYASAETEDFAVARQIQGLVNRGVPPQEIAVLFRYHRDGTELQAILQQLNVPVRLEAGENVLADSDIVGWLELLTYIVSPDRDDLLGKAVYGRWWHLDPLDIQKVLRLAGQTRRRLRDVVGDEAALAAAKVTEPERWLKVSEQLARWQMLAATTSAPHFLQLVLEESGWLRELAEASGPLKTLQKLNALLGAARNGQSETVTSVADFLARVQLLREHDLPLIVEPWQQPPAAVRLMTAHRAKGLEFEHVFITRANDRHWGNNPTPARVTLPHGFVKYDYIVAAENNEDERRLFYVAMTRAKQGLYVSRAEHNVSGRPTAPSLFLAELPAADISRESVPESNELAVARLHVALAPPRQDQEAQAAALRAWLREILRGYVFSATHLNTYLSCPRQFYLRHILQVPELQTTAAALGSAVHRALEAFFRAYRDDAVPSRTGLLRSFQEYLEREPLTAIDRQAVGHVGEELLGGYWDHYHDTFVRPLQLEYDFRSHDVRVDGVPITGKLDKIEPADTPARRAGGRPAVRVVDYKTGQADRAAGALKPGGAYHRQLVFYQLLCDHAPRFPYTMREGTIDFIAPSKRRGYVQYTVQVTRHDSDELRRTIGRVWGEILSLRFLAEDAACGQCWYCQNFHAHQDMGAPVA